MAFGRKKGDRKAPDGKFYQPDDPIWASFGAGSATVVDETIQEPNGGDTEVAMEFASDAEEAPVVVPVRSSEQEAQKIRATLKDYGEEERDQPEYSSKLLENLKRPLAPQPSRSLDQQSKRQPTSAELAASQRRREILEGFHVEDQRRAKMSPSEFAREGLGPISATLLTLTPDPSEYFTVDGKRPCGDDETLHWVNIRDESTGKETTMNTDRMRRTGSMPVFDDTGFPVMRNDCVLMKVNVERQAWRQAQAMKDSTKTAHETQLAKDNDERARARTAGMRSGPMTYEGGTVARDAFQARAATAVRPGEVAID